MLYSFAILSYISAHRDN
uniref:Uncharacterized protein n=1 Tax=Arundo donax TaxID=35708 RepID=A0A0A9HI13_ARUDO